MCILCEDYRLSETPAPTKMLIPKLVDASILVDMMCSMMEQVVDGNTGLAMITLTQAVHYVRSCDGPPF